VAQIVARHAVVSRRSQTASEGRSGTRRFVFAPELSRLSTAKDLADELVSLETVDALACHAALCWAHPLSFDLALDGRVTTAARDFVPDFTQHRVECSSLESIAITFARTL
jgi:hypothetical protein